MPSSPFLSSVWTQGDTVTRLIVIVLLTMSVLSWVVFVLKALDVWRQRQNARASERFWDGAQPGAGLTVPDPRPDNLFHALAQAGQQAAEHLRAVQAQRPDRQDIGEWVTRSLRHAIDEQTARLQAGLAILASVGSTAPFIGLFGTVWGIHHALVRIGASGSAGIDAVAGPIGETLLMTGLGLAVAIPAVLGYNTLVRGNRFIVGRMNRFAHDLHAHLVTGARVAPGARHGL